VEKRKKKRGRRKLAKLFTRIVKAFNFNAIRTKHSRLMFSCAGFSRKPSFVLRCAWRSEKFIPSQSEKQKREKEREREREKLE